MPDPNPSMASLITGDEVRDDVELGKRVWPRREKVGVTGDGRSVEDVAGVYCDLGDILVSSFFRASNN